MASFGWETVVACAVAVTVLALCRGWLQRARREWFLAAVSMMVLAKWQLAGLAVTLALIGVAWLAVRPGATGNVGARGRVAGAVVAVLVAALVVFKYAPWIAVHFSDLPSGITTRWVVPFGLSFTVFRLIGVVQDYRALKAPIPGHRLLLLSLFFPTFPSGPITTVQSFRELGEEAGFRSRVREGAARILQGLIRKSLLADPLNALVIKPWLEYGVARLEPYQSLVLPFVLGMYVYWDFAGYSDIAIGLARLMGYQVPENFNAPYLSRNVVEFWRRWHITLSEWIRTRLMMKMVSRRSPPWRLHLATVVSMALCGLWHGAGLGYLLWGIWHGLGLVAVHLFGEAQRRSDKVRWFAQAVMVDSVSTAATFAFVTLGWTLFFFQPADALNIIRGALAWRGGTREAVSVPFLMFGGLIAAYLSRGLAHIVWGRLPSPMRRTLVVVLLGGLSYVLLFISGGRPDFLYARF